MASDQIDGLRAAGSSVSAALRKILRAKEVYLALGTDDVDWALGLCDAWDKSNRQVHRLLYGEPGEGKENADG